MITQAPPPPVPQYSNVSTVQANQLQDASMPQNIKRVYLRHLLRAAISENAAQGVRTGVTVTDVGSGRTLFSQDADAKHFAASVNKIPVALLVLEDLRAGELSLDQVVTWQASDVRGGFGDYDQPGAPLQATLEQILFDMLNKSGNTVVRATVNYLLGGPAAANARFAEKPGLQNTSLTVLTPTSFFLGDSTPNDSLWALQKLMKRQDSYARFMRDALATNIFTDFGVRSQLPEGNDSLLVNKIGLLDDPDGNNRHDVGLIYNKHSHKTYGYSFFTTTAFENTAGTARADQSLKDMGTYVLRYADKHRGKRFTRHHDFRPEHRRIRY